MSNLIAQKACLLYSMIIYFAKIISNNQNCSLFLVDPLVDSEKIAPSTSWFIPHISSLRLVIEL